jgi:hypothetical protein
LSLQGSVVRFLDDQVPLDLEHLLLFPDLSNLLLLVLLNQEVYLPEVFVLLRVTHLENPHVVVCWIGKGWLTESNGSEIACTLFSLTLVDYVAISHEDESVESHVCVTAWLMDSCNHSLALSCLSSHYSHKSQSHVAVQSRCRLIK